MFRFYLFWLTAIAEYNYNDAYWNAVYEGNYSMINIALLLQQKNKKVK